MWKRLPPLIKISSWIILIVIGMLISFFILLFSGAFGHIPSEKELKEIRQQEASLVYSADGALIGKFFVTNRTHTQYDSLPSSLIDALLATEDIRFYEHEGVDGKALLRVLLKSILMGDRSAGGGSTITQQLAKNLFGRNDYGSISIAINKLKEIILANRLENLYSKEEIIELYLNTVPFGENIYGVEAASLRYFSKSANELKTEESAVLIGLLKANSYYNPRLNPNNALERRNVVLSQMEKYELISQNEADSLMKLPISLAYQNLDRETTLPYFLNRLKKEALSILKEINRDKSDSLSLSSSGLVIGSTLDKSLQEHLFEGMKVQLKKMQSLLRAQYQRAPYASKLDQLSRKIMAQNNLPKNSDEKDRLFFDWFKQDSLMKTNIEDSIKHVLTQLHSGAIALDANSGGINAWIGGINYPYFPYDQVLAKRQLASTIKPILYAAALEEGFHPCTYLSNDEIVLTDYEGWAPQNYDGESGGEYSMAAALAFSKNLPSLDLYLKVGWDPFSDMWNKLGFIDPLNKEPSVILGTNSSNLLELASAYAVFANGGKKLNPYTIEFILDAHGDTLYRRPQVEQEQLLYEENSHRMNEMLSKTVNEGTASALLNTYGISAPLAAKTGTSQSYADAWTVVYNRKKVVAVRVGASYPSIRFASGAYGSSTRLALPIIGKALQLEKGKAWLRAGLDKSNQVDCENYRGEKGIDKFLNLFKKKEVDLEKAKKRSKRKGFLNKLFKGDE